MTRGELRVVTVAIAAAVSSTLPVFLIGPLAPRIRAELDFDKAQLGLAIGLCQAVSAATAWALGRQVVRVGPRRATRAAMVLSAVSLLGIATVAHDWAGIVLLLAFCGISSAICQPATNALLLHGIEPTRMGQAFGIKLASIPLTALLAGLAVPLIAAPLGWRAAFLLAALLPAAAFLAIPAPQVGIARRGGAERGRPETSLLALVLLALGTGLVIGSATTVPGFFVESAAAAGVREQWAALVLSAGALCGIAARLALGRLVDRRSDLRLGTVAVMSAVGAIGHLLLRSDPLIVQALGVVMVFSLGWGWVGLFQYLISRLNPGNPGAATGITDTGGYLGAFLAPVVVGLIAARNSFGSAWTATAIATLVGSGLIATADRVLRHRRAPTQLR
jgi:MFS family permease